MTLPPRQFEMLKSLDADGEPTDYADFSDRGGAALGWRNRERVIEALIRRGFIDGDSLQLTEPGKDLLACAEASIKAKQP
jgi:hypothetical protein